MRYLLRLAPPLLSVALSLTAIAHEGEHPPETWHCQGVYQTEPGKPVTAQSRTLTLPLRSDKAVMNIDGAGHEGRFETAGQYVMAWFALTGSGGEQLTEEITLGLVNGKLATTVTRGDGSRVAIFRGGCQPEPHP